MYTSLGNRNYEDSKDILSKMPNLNIDFHKSLIAQFELEERAKDDDEYVPIYILDINEDIENMFEESITDMIIDK